MPPNNAASPLYDHRQASGAVGGGAARSPRLESALRLQYSECNPVRIPLIARQKERFLMNTGSLTIPTKDGRELRISVVGQPDGIPILTHHGTPGSRLPNPLNHEKSGSSATIDLAMEAHPLIKAALWPTPLRTLPRLPGTSI